MNHYFFFYYSKRVAGSFPSFPMAQVVDSVSDGRDKKRSEKEEGVKVRNKRPASL